LQLLSADEALRKLSVPLTKAYSNESDFDTALFEALRDCLRQQELPTDDKNIILLNSTSNDHHYGLGIARQQAGALSLLDSNKSIQKYAIGGTSSGLKALSRPDHAVCLFQKNADKWRVSDCLSVVELKMSDKSCEPFSEPFNVLSDGIYEVDLARRHGALGQAIMYNIGCVLLHRARRGIESEHLPLAVIAGTRGDTASSLQEKIGEHTSTKQNKRVTLRWVSGDIGVPNACGGRFSYSIKDFGQFHDEDKNQKDRSVEQALSLYIETMLFGLIDAAKV